MVESRSCPACGVKLSLDVVRCPRCGERLDEDDVARSVSESGQPSEAEDAPGFSYG